MRQPDLSDERIERWRAYTGGYAYSDDAVRNALRQARHWVGGMRYSDSIVALNILKDGYPHA